jgi:pimeloyl-ACP methyl ester carboxylesterase
VYADINGLKMYYEIHGTGNPVVLLHGAMSATGTSFGLLVDALARTRQVIAVEQQGHGRTADIDRPLSVTQMADDTLALLASLGIERADLYGYSLGAGIAVYIVIRQPAVVRKAVLASVVFDSTGFHPGLLENIAEPSPARSPFEQEYLELAPNPAHWPQLVAKIQAMRLPEITADTVSAIQIPLLLIIGDSDIVVPEHTVVMYRLLGGGVLGDADPLPASQLAILPGTSHTGIPGRTDMLMTMIPPFLDAP